MSVRKKNHRFWNYRVCAYFVVVLLGTASSAWSIHGDRTGGSKAARGGCGVRGCQQETPVDATRCGMPAPNYPVPFATPHPTVPTQLTYPPLMPHNSLHHYRGTYSYRHGEGLSRTNVMWYAPPVKSGLKWIHHLIELPR